MVKRTLIMYLHCKNIGLKDLKTICLKYACFVIKQDNQVIQYTVKYIDWTINYIIVDKVFKLEILSFCYMGVPRNMTIGE